MADICNCNDLDRSSETTLETVDVLVEDGSTEENIRFSATHKTIDWKKGLQFDTVKDMDIPTIVIEDCNENNTEIETPNDGIVILRRKKTSFLQTIETSPDDDYKYFDYLQVPKSGTSRRKIEIGSEKMISDNDLRLAATLVHDAMEGRTVDFKTEPKYVRSYNRYKSWPLTYLLYLTLVVDLSMVVFEEPAVKGFSTHYSCVLLLVGLCGVLVGIQCSFVCMTAQMVKVTLSVECLCLVYFTARTCHNFHWRRTKTFFKDLNNIFIVGILTITVIDIIVYISVKQFSDDGPTVRFSRVLRPLLIVNFSDGRQVTLSVECLCLVYFTARTCHNFHWRRTKTFFKDLNNIFIVGILTITVIDIIVYISVKQFSDDGPTVRFSRVLRPLLIVNFSDGRQIRRAWRNLRRTIKEIVHVLVLFYFFIFVFALIAYKMFSTRGDLKYPDGKDYFKDYMDCVWDLYVLVTTSNNPDVMMPAIEKSRFYCIFFFAYILVCFYMLLNVFLAVAYHSYNENMKEEIKRSVRDKKRKLLQAFDVIKVNRNGEDMVTYRIWKRLMTLAQPDLSKNQIDLLMLILDMNRSGNIGKREFMNVADLLNVPVSEVEDRVTLIERWFPNLYNSSPAEYLKSFVDSVFFKFSYDVIVVTELFLIAFDVQYIDVWFCAIFLLEIFVKLFTYGLYKYFKRFGNWFDVLITTAAIIIILTERVFNIEDQVFRDTANIIKIIRIFRILRLLVHFKRFKIIIDTLVNISLSILMYCGILFIIFYIFAIVGIEIFKGKISSHSLNVSNHSSVEGDCGAPELGNSSFYQSRYCSLNFNDFISSILVLSTILFENNWHVLTEGYVIVAGKAARIYFAVFFMCVSVVVMNIVTAFVVDMFMYEYTIQKEGKVDSAVEKKIKELGLGIDAETGLEISAPLSDIEMKELLHGDNLPEPQQHPWIEKSTLRGWRNAEVRFSAISSFVQKRKSSVPTLNRFDGIRFHIKKRGWTKIELLLQQLYDVECDTEETLCHTDNGQKMEARN